MPRAGSPRVRGSGRALISRMEASAHPHLGNKIGAGEPLPLHRAPFSFPQELPEPLELPDVGQLAVADILSEREDEQAAEVVPSRMAAEAGVLKCDRAERDD